MSDATNGIIDLGIVVRDLQRSVAFYRDALGFEPLYTFDVPASVGGNTGLSDHKPFTVQVMQLAGTEAGTKIKLIEFAEAPVNPTAFIHLATGVRYLTLHVPDITAVCDQAAQAGCKPLAKGPAKFAENVWIAVIRDPDGNMVELVGPKK